MVKMSKFGAGLGAPSKEERLREAADIHIRLGNVQKYCELMVELGQVRTSSCMCVHFVQTVHTHIVYTQFMYTLCARSSCTYFMHSYSIKFSVVKSCHVI